MKFRNQLNRFGTGLRPLFANDDGGGGGEGGGGGGDPGAGGGEGGDPGAGGEGGDGGQGGEGGEPAANYFQQVPEDWRSQALTAMGLEEGTDEFKKRHGQMERVSDSKVLFKNYFEAQDRIRKGEIAAGLPENPTDEQLAEYRTANGVPESPDAYELSLEDGLVLGDADKELMKGVFENAHAGNVPAAVMSQMTSAYLSARQTQMDQMMAQDGLDEQSTTQQLKEAWGGDLERNKNMVNALISQLPSTIQDEFKNARLASGKALLNSPEVMVAMSDWMSKIDPAALVVPGSNNPMQTIDDELSSMKTRMSEDSEGWYKDKGAQARYQELLTAKERMSKAS